MSTFNWIEQAFRLAQVIRTDTENVFDATSDMFEIVNTPSDKYSDTFSSVLDLLAEGKFDDIVKGYASLIILFSLFNILS